MTKTEGFSSLRSDLASRIADDILLTGSARVYGPTTTMVTVWNAAERAGRWAGIHTQVTQTAPGRWLVTR